MGARHVHAADHTPHQSDRARRTDLEIRRDLSRTHEVLGEMIRASRAAERVSAADVAVAVGVDERTLRRWEDGEASAPLDLIDRLPPRVAQRLAELLVARVDARVAPVAESDYMRALRRNIGVLMQAEAEGRVDGAALSALSIAARRAAGRAAGGER